MKFGQWLWTPSFRPSATSFILYHWYLRISCMKSRRDLPGKLHVVLSRRGAFQFSWKCMKAYEMEKNAVIYVSLFNPLSDCLRFLSNLSCEGEKACRFLHREGACLPRLKVSISFLLVALRRCTMPYKVRFMEDNMLLLERWYSISVSTDHIAKSFRCVSLERSPWLSL